MPLSTRSEATSAGPARDTAARDAALLLLILIAYIGLALGYALATPRWNNPDEPAHYNYIQHVAEVGRLPELRPGDWDADLLERLKAARFPEDASIFSIRYESHQPPLYYLLAAAVFLALDGASLPARVFVLKVFSIALGTLVVLCSYVAARQVQPRRPAMALLAAATAAFVPMFTAISAAINNDSLANALAAVAVVVILAVWQSGVGDRGSVLIGLLFGALVLTKVTVYPYVLLGLVAVASTEYRGGARWPALLRRPALAATAALAVSAWWIVRNMLVYGPTDPLASARHAAVVVGQPRWDRLDLAALQTFATVLFRSFWGQFGWMGVLLDQRIYLLYGLLALLALVGLALAVPAVGAPAGKYDAARRARAAILASAIALTLGGVVYYNLTFIQPQGRYLFPALVPIAVFLAWGWSETCEQAARAARLPRQASGPLLFALGLGLGLLDLTSLIRYVAPAFR